MFVIVIAPVLVCLEFFNFKVLLDLISKRFDFGDCVACQSFGACYFCEYLSLFAGWINCFVSEVVLDFDFDDHGFVSLCWCVVLIFQRLIPLLTYVNHFI